MGLFESRFICARISARAGSEEAEELIRGRREQDGPTDPLASFEQLVVDLLVAMGYGGPRRDAGQAFGQGGDGGVHGIIKEDKLGLDVVYVHAKRRDKAVDRPEVQGFAGSVMGYGARKDVSSLQPFDSPGCCRLCPNIVHIDSQQLTQVMIDHGVSVAEVAK